MQGGEHHEFQPDRLSEDGGFGGAFPAQNQAYEKLGSPGDDIESIILMSSMSLEQGLANIELMVYAAEFGDYGQLRTAIFSFLLSSANLGRARTEIVSVARSSPEHVQAQIAREQRGFGRVLRRILGRGKGQGEEDG